MKRALQFLCVGLLLIGCMGCLAHEVRISNTSSYDFLIVEIGGVLWQNIDSNAISVYQEVEEGTHDINVNLVGYIGTAKLGTTTLTGNPLLGAKWTISIGDSTVTIERD